MTPGPDLPAWAALLTSMLLLLGAFLAFTGSLGLLRLANFYERAHAPTLGTTLGIGSVLLASMLFFSVLQTRPALHEVLIALFVVVTTPVTLLLLARAALYRDRREGTDEVPLRPSPLPGDGANAAATGGPSCEADAAVSASRPASKGMGARRPPRSPS